MVCGVLVGGVVFPAVVEGAECLGVADEGGAVVFVGLDVVVVAVSGGSSAAGVLAGVVS